MSVLKAKLNFSFLCDYASVSREGKLSMNGIFENINVRSFPTHHPLMFIVTNISGVNNNDSFTCELLSCKNPTVKIAAISQKIITDPQRNFGFIGQFINVRYESAGEYTLKFYIDNKEIGAHNFSVNLV